jgi:Glycosyl transferase family 2
VTERLVRFGSALAVAGLAHSMANSRVLRRPVARPPAPPPSVAILIPARNEADLIADCLTSARGQGDVIVLDDESTDGTGAVARATGARVLDGSPPPPGWLGKPWACAQLTAATSADVLVFLDADVRLAPGAVAAAVAVLDQAGLDVVCPFPRQLAETATERLVQPLLQWSWLTTLPLRLAERSPRPSLTAACGQFLVVRRSALERAGGHTAVRDQVLDDLALVRAVKAAGGRGGVIDGTDLATCRMYDGWPALRDGYRKSLWAAFGSPVGAGVVVSLLAVTYVLPPLAALRGSRAGAIGYLAGVASRIVTARRTGGRALPDAFAHPVSVAMVGLLTVDSVRGRRSGTLRWKGRTV